MQVVEVFCNFMPDTDFPSALESLAFELNAIKSHTEGTLKEQPFYNYTKKQNLVHMISLNFFPLLNFWTLHKWKNQRIIRPRLTSFLQTWFKRPKDTGKIWRRMELEEAVAIYKAFYRQHLADLRQVKPCNCATSLRTSYRLPKTRWQGEELKQIQYTS